MTVPNDCKTCGRVIRVMAFVGDDYCSVDCRRAADGLEPIPAPPTDEESTP